MPTATETGVQVLSTRNYDSLKTMTGNRTIDQKHVAKLKSAMLMNPDAFKTNPGVVNKDGFIIDGQHRFEAAKQSNLPFYYILNANATLENARDMNFRQKSWGMHDFAHSFADSGKEAYVELLAMHRRFPRISLSTLVIINDYEIGSDQSHHNFRTGAFTIFDREDFQWKAEFFSNIVTIADRNVLKMFVRDMLNLLDNNADFKPERYLERLEKKPNLFVPGGQSRDNLRNIEDVYNFDMHTNKVRFY